jgi:hypothetical protein
VHFLNDQFLLYRCRDIDNDTDLVERMMICDLRTKQLREHFRYSGMRV